MFHLHLIFVFAFKFFINIQFKIAWNENFNCCISYLMKETRTDMCNVRVQQCPDLVCNLTELGKVESARIRRSTTNNHLGAKQFSAFSQFIKINQSSCRIHTIGQRFKKYRRRRYLLRRREETWSPKQIEYDDWITIRADRKQ